MNTQLLESIKSLSIAERVQLVEDVWDSIADSEEVFSLTEAQEIELEHRLDALEKGQSPLASWDEVKTRIASRL